MNSDSLVRKDFSYRERELSSLLRSGNKIYGELGRGLPQKVNTGQEDIGNLKGRYGENVIGSLLNLLTLETKDMFVFHSVANPDGSSGETDHIILYRNKIILVETKTYNNFNSLLVTKNGELKGVPASNTKALRKLDNNNLIRKMGIFSEAFPGFQVHAITAVSRAGVITTSENGKYKVVSLDNLVQSLSYHQAQSSQIDDAVTFKSVKSLANLCLLSAL